MGATDEITGVGYPVILNDSIATQTKGFWQESVPRDGHGGFGILDTKAGIDASIAAVTITPGHILILLGANDVAPAHWALFNEATWKAAYQYVIDACHAKWSSAKIYLGKSFRTGYEVNLITVAGWIDDLVSSNPGVCFAGIDSRTFYDGHEAELLIDDVHPNHAGFIVMAAAWKAAMGY